MQTTGTWVDPDRHPITGQAHLRFNPDGDGNLSVESGATLLLSSNGNKATDINNIQTANLNGTITLHNSRIEGDMETVGQKITLDGATVNMTGDYANMEATQIDIKDSTISADVLDHGLVSATRMDVANSTVNLTKESHLVAYGDKELGGTGALNITNGSTITLSGGDTTRAGSYLYGDSINISGSTLTTYGRDYIFSTKKNNQNQFSLNASTLNVDCGTLAIYELNNSIYVIDDNIGEKSDIVTDIISTYRRKLGTRIGTLYASDSTINMTSELWGNIVGDVGTILHIKDSDAKISGSVQGVALSIDEGVSFSSDNIEGGIKSLNAVNINGTNSNSADLTLKNIASPIDTLSATYGSLDLIDSEIYAQSVSFTNGSDLTLKDSTLEVYSNTPLSFGSGTTVSLSDSMIATDENITFQDGSTLSIVSGRNGLMGSDITLGDTEIPENTSLEILDYAKQGTKTPYGTLNLNGTLEVAGTLAGNIKGTENSNSILEITGKKASIKGSIDNVGLSVSGISYTLDGGKVGISNLKSLAVEDNGQLFVQNKKMYPSEDDHTLSGDPLSDISVSNGGKLILKNSNLVSDDLLIDEGEINLSGSDLWVNKQVGTASLSFDQPIFNLTNSDIMIDYDLNLTNATGNFNDGSIDLFHNDGGNLTFAGDQTNIKLNDAEIQGKTLTVEAGKFQLKKNSEMTAQTTAVFGSDEESLEISMENSMIGALGTRGNDTRNGILYTTFTGNADTTFENGSILNINSGTNYLMGTNITLSNTTNIQRKATLKVASSYAYENKTGKQIYGTGASSAIKLDGGTINLAGGLYANIKSYASNYGTINIIDSKAILQGSILPTDENEASTNLNLNANFDFKNITGIIQNLNTLSIDAGKKITLTLSKNLLGLNEEDLNIQTLAMGSGSVLNLNASWEDEDENSQDLEAWNSVYATGTLNLNNAGLKLGQGAEGAFTIENATVSAKNADIIARSTDEDMTINNAKITLQNSCLEKAEAGDLNITNSNITVSKRGDSAAFISKVDLDDPQYAENPTTEGDINITGSNITLNDHGFIVRGNWEDYEWEENEGELTYQQATGSGAINLDNSTITMNNKSQIVFNNADTDSDLNLLYLKNGSNLNINGNASISVNANNLTGNLYTLLMDSDVGSSSLNINKGATLSVLGDSLKIKGNYGESINIAGTLSGVSYFSNIPITLSRNATIQSNSSNGITLFGADLTITGNNTIDTNGDIKLRRYIFEDLETYETGYLELRKGATLTLNDGGTRNTLKVSDSALLLAGKLVGNIEIVARDPNGVQGENSLILGTGFQLVSDIRNSGINLDTNYTHTGGEITGFGVSGLKSSKTKEFTYLYDLYRRMDGDSDFTTLIADSSNFTISALKSLINTAKTARGEAGFAYSNLPNLFLSKSTLTVDAVEDFSSLENLDLEASTLNVNRNLSFTGTLYADSGSNVNINKGALLSVDEIELHDSSFTVSGDKRNPNSTKIEAAEIEVSNINNPKLGVNVSNAVIDLSGGTFSAENMNSVVFKNATINGTLSVDNDNYMPKSKVSLTNLKVSGLDLANVKSTSIANSNISSLDHRVYGQDNMPTINKRGDTVYQSTATVSNSTFDSISVAGTALYLGKGTKFNSNGTLTLADPLSEDEEITLDGGIEDVSLAVVQDNITIPNIQINRGTLWVTKGKTLSSGSPIVMKGGNSKFYIEGTVIGDVQEDSTATSDSKLEFANKNARLKGDVNLDNITLEFKSVKGKLDDFLLAKGSSPATLNFSNMSLRYSTFNWGWDTSKLNVNNSVANNAIENLTMEASTLNLNRALTVHTSNSDGKLKMYGSTTHLAGKNLTADNLEMRDSQLYLEGGTLTILDTFNMGKSKLYLGTSQLNTKDANIESNSTIYIDVVSDELYGQLNAENLYFSTTGSETNPTNITLSVTLPRKGIDIGQGETQYFNFLTYDNEPDGDDLQVKIANNRYHFTQTSPGQFTVTTDKKGVIDQADPVAVANALTFAALTSADQNSSATDNLRADQLNVLSQHASSEVVNKTMAGISPDNGGTVIQNESSTVNTLMDAVSGKLASGATAVGLNGGDSVGDNATMWAQALYNHTKLGNDGSYTGFKGNSRGMAMGATFNFTKTIKGGLAYHYMDTDIKAGDRKMDVDTHGIALYGEYKPNNWFVDAIAGFSFSDYDSKSETIIGTISSDFDVYTYSAQATTGYEFELSDKVKMTPSVGLRYTLIDQDDYTDSDGKKISSDKNDILTLRMGDKFAWEYTTQKGTVITPELYLGMSYDLHTDQSHSLVSLSNGSQYQVEGRNLKRFGINGGLGVKMTTDAWDFILGSDMDVRQDYRSYTGTFKAKYHF